MGVVTRVLGFNRRQEHKSTATITVAGVETGGGAKKVYCWTNGTLKTYAILSQTAALTAAAVAALINAISGITASAVGAAITVTTDDSGDLAVFFATDSADQTFAVDSGPSQMALLDDVTAAAVPALPTDGVACGKWEWIDIIALLKNGTVGAGTLTFNVYTMDPATLLWQLDADVGDVSVSAATATVAVKRIYFRNKGNRRVDVAIKALSAGCTADVWALVTSE